jgi:hypothetical protein
MSEIPFIHDLGEALDAAIATQRSRRRFGGRRPSRMSRRGLLALVLGALLAGGGAAAATLLGPSQRLADGNIDCFFTTAPGPTLSARTPDAGAQSVGPSPIATCRRWYRLNAHTGIDASTLGFVACRHNATTVDVYVADNRPRQCQRLGERPLPATYPAALARLRALEARLDVIQRRRACKSPRALAQEVRDALTSLGLNDWRIALPPSHPSPRLLNSPAGTGGTCATLIYSPAANAPGFPAQLQPNRRTVSISTGPPRHLSTLVYHASATLYQQTYQHCFTAASVRALVRRAFADSRLVPRFTTNAAPVGQSYLPSSQRLYDKGCVRFRSAYVVNGDRFVDVWLNARGAPRLPTHQQFPPASAFRAS